MDLSYLDFAIIVSQKLLSVENSAFSRRQGTGI